MKSSRGNSKTAWAYFVLPGTSAWLPTQETDVDRFLIAKSIDPVVILTFLWNVRSYALCLFNNRDTGLLAGGIGVLALDI